MNNGRIALIAVIVVVILVGSYIGLGQVSSNTPISVSKNGITAQVISCDETFDSNHPLLGEVYYLTVELTANPAKVHLYEIYAGNNATGWAGTVALSGYGLSAREVNGTAMGFQNFAGDWTAYAPVEIPIGELSNYNCQLGGWTPILNTY